MAPPVPELQRKGKNKKLKLGGDGRRIGGLVLLGGLVAAGTLTALVTNQMRKKQGEPINCSTVTSEAQPKIPSTLTTNQEPQGEISEAIAVVEEPIVGEAEAERVENGGTVAAREIASGEIKEVNMAVKESTGLKRKKKMEKYAVAGGVFLLGTAFGYLLANRGKGNRTVNGTEDDDKVSDVSVSENGDGNENMEPSEVESAEKIQLINDRKNVQGTGVRCISGTAGLVNGFHASPYKIAISKHDSSLNGLADFVDEEFVDTDPAFAEAGIDEFEDELYP